MTGKTPANPFILGRYIDDRYFCDREAETALLKKHITNGRNVTLISPRRMGKTGLINHFFNQEDIKSAYSTVLLDIYATGNLAEFSYMLSNAVYSSVKGTLKSDIEHFFKTVSSLRVGLKIDAITGEPTFDLKLGQIQSPENTLKEIFDYLEKMPRQAIIAIDEFQRIGEYPERNVEAMLRTMIQRCRNVQFIFAGSERHLLGNMFNSPSKPFYQSAMMMTLKEIEPEVYADFAVRLFEEHGKKLSKDTVYKVYALCRGITWNNQAIMNELFAETPDDQTCQSSAIEGALYNIIEQYSSYYLDVMARLSERQKGLLIAIARKGDVTGITSHEFISSAELPSASSVQSALRMLERRDLVTRAGDVYRVTDPFFSHWLSSY